MKEDLNLLLDLSNQKFENKFKLYDSEADQSPKLAKIRVKFMEKVLSTLKMVLYRCVYIHIYIYIYM